MFNKQSKNIISVFLALIMIAGIFPASVLASGEGDTPAPEYAAGDFEQYTYSEEADEPGDVDDYLTVTFMVPGEGNPEGPWTVYRSVQVLAESGQCTPPETPGLPEGMVSFRGWFVIEDPSEDEQAFDFASTKIVTDIVLYAAFSEHFLITYKDQYGKVIQTDKLNQGDSILGPSDETQKIIVPPEGQRFIHWYLEGGAPSVAFNFGGSAAATGDMTFCPYFSNSHMVIFNSGGSYVEPQTVVHGEYAEQPASPTRSGYTFDYWYAYGGDEEPFDFQNSPITDDTVLVAKWNAQSVNYTVAIWLEKPNFAGTPNPNDQSGYNYVTSVALSGTAGEDTGLDINILPFSIASLFNGKAETILKYGSPQHVDNKAIQGNGLTVINLYAARKVYTYIFDLGTSISRTMIIGGTTYTGNSSVRHSVNVKYEMDIAGVFPVQGIGFATFSSGFASWQRPDAKGTYSEKSGMRWKDTANIASIRKYVDESMLSEDGQALSYTLLANWDASSSSYQYRYFAESLPGQTGTAIVRSGINYFLMAEYNQSYHGDLTAKNINGLTRTNSNNYVTYYYLTGGNNAGTYTTSKPSGTGAPSYETFRCFFYNRTTHQLTFDMMLPAGAVALNTPKNEKLMFEESLQAYKPAENPTVQGGSYSFAGWYRDAGYKEPFDFASLTMPIGGMIAYARWESTDNIVSFLDSRNGAAKWTQGVANGGYAENKAEYWSKGCFVEGKGAFDGWYHDISGIPVAWSWETVINTDYTLYATWKTDGFTITYNAGEGTGNAPVDTNTYNMYTTARVKEEAGLTPPSGKVFYAWKTEGTNKLYYPGALLSINENGSVTLVAQYARADELAEIIYHSNFDTDVTMARKVYWNSQSIEIASGDIFTRQGYTFELWTAAADGTGTQYNADETVKASDLGITGAKQTVHLYAQWELETDDGSTPTDPGPGPGPGDGDGDGDGDDTDIDDGETPLDPGDGDNDEEDVDIDDGETPLDPGEDGTDIGGDETPLDGAPKTGDDNNISIWIALLAASLFGIIALLIPRKRKSRNTI